MDSFFHHVYRAFTLPLENPILVFSLILLIILMAPLLLRKFNIPGIIVLIISGVLIGPHGFNVLQKNSAVELFSTIGLLYIMFIAGLDLDISEFKINRYKSLLFGFFTFIIPLSIGYPVCYYLLGYGFDSSLLTASMFATHTLIAYPIVSRLGISKNQAVAITVGGTILTDTAVLILLAIIVGNTEGSLDSAFWVRLAVSMLILFFIVFYIVPKVAKWFFKKLESEKHSHYIFVLAVLFFSAFLAEMAGVEAIIGAFLAGLALNRLIPHSSALMNRIEFIGNSLFIPFFLISVGMIVDLSVILKGPTALIVAAALTLVALSGKWIAAFVTQLVFKFSGEERRLIFGLSSSHAAATLAIILVGYRAGILDANILNGTIILILITCIVSSFVTERAAKKILLTTNTHQDALKFIKFKDEHILIPVSLESSLEKLLDFALLIKDKKSHTPITLLTVIPNSKDAELELVATRNKLGKYVKHAAASEAELAISATLDFNILGGIVRTARELLADIIIIGWPRKVGLINRIIGGAGDNLEDNVDKTLFVSKITQPLVMHKRIVLLLVPFGENENGFLLWYRKIFQLSQELSLPIFMYCNQASQANIAQLLKKHKMYLELKFVNYENWDDLSSVAPSVNDADLLVVTSARKGSVSYISQLDQITSKLDRFFAENNKIVVFPQQFENQHSPIGMDNVSSIPLEKGIEGVQKLGKNISKIVKWFS